MLDAGLAFPAEIPTRCIEKAVTKVTTPQVFDLRPQRMPVKVGVYFRVAL
jgi:hypothetical protein